MDNRFLLYTRMTACLYLYQKQKNTSFLNFDNIKLLSYDIKLLSIHQKNPLKYFTKWASRILMRPIVSNHKKKGYLIFLCVFVTPWFQHVSSWCIPLSWLCFETHNPGGIDFSQITVCRHNRYVSQWIDMRSVLLTYFKRFVHVFLFVYNFCLRVLFS